MLKHARWCCVSAVFYEPQQTASPTVSIILHISYQQAQQTVQLAIPKLKKLGIATKRPEDYFAEMVKTDDHMQRVCS